LQKHTYKTIKIFHVKVARCSWRTFENLWHYGT